MQRNPGESFEDYKERRANEKKALKFKQKRAFIHFSNSDEYPQYRSDVSLFFKTRTLLNDIEFYAFCLETVQDKTADKIIIQKAQQYIDEYLKEKQSVAPTTDC